MIQLKAHYNVIEEGESRSTKFCRTWKNHQTFGKLCVPNKLEFFLNNFTDTVTSSTSTIDMEILPRFGSGKRKFQRTRTSFVTGQISILERGTVN